jgi:hypothetical protein
VIVPAVSFGILFSFDFPAVFAAILEFSHAPKSHSSETRSLSLEE